MARLDRLYAEMGSQESRPVRGLQPIQRQVPLRVHRGHRLAPREPGSASLITDFRYEEQARQEVYPGVKVVIDKRDVLAASCETLAAVEGKIGFEAGSLTFAAYEKLAGGGRWPSWRPPQGLVEGYRKVKDAG